MKALFKGLFSSLRFVLFVVLDVLWGLWLIIKFMLIVTFIRSITR